MRTLTQTLLLVIVLFLGSSNDASAATLRTPLLVGSSFVLCVATNVGAKPIDVSVAVTDAAGAALASATDTCNGTPVAPQSSCYVQVTAFSSAIPIGGFCSFTSNKKFRAIGYGTSGPTAVAIPATK